MRGFDNGWFIEYYPQQVVPMDRGKGHPFPSFVAFGVVERACRSGLSSPPFLWRGKVGGVERATAADLTRLLGLWPVVDGSCYSARQDIALAVINPNGRVRMISAFQWRDPLQRYKGVGIILLLFCSLGLVWSVTVPLFETPDEVWHYAYVKNIADGHGLPVQNPDIEQPWRQEGSQPPLYYLTAALLTFWIDTADYSELAWWNPFSEGARPGQVDDNQNLFIHTSQESFPYRGTVLAMHVARLLSLAMGAVTVLATYLIASEIFPHRKEVSIGAAAINAFNPQFTFISGSVSNDAMVSGLSSLALLLMVRIVNRGASSRRVTMLGALVGLALLTKLSALALLPLALVVLIAAAWRRGSRASFLRWGVLFLVVVGSIAGWWYVRNWLLYGDPLGTVTMLRTFGYWHERSLREVLSQRNLKEVEINFWAAFGWGNIRVKPLIYKGVCFVTLLAGVGLVIGMVKALRGRRPNISRGLGLGILLFWVIMVFAALVRWMQVTSASLGRLFFPAISSISILISWGLMELVPKKFSRGLSLALGGFMISFNTISLLLYVVPAYARPPLLSPTEAVSLPNQVKVLYGSKVELLAYELESGAVRPGERAGITFYWRCLTEMEESLNIFVRILGREGQLIGEKESYPGGGSYPTTEWRRGEVIKDTYRIRISPHATVPTGAWVQVGLFDLATMSEVPAYDGMGRPVVPLLGPVKIASWSPLQVEPRTRMEVNLGQKVNLIGYDLEETFVQPGGDIHLTLYWEALKAMEEDYTVFVHLIDGEGRIWAQKDNQPLENDYPTSLWERGEVVEDEYELEVGSEVPEGGYRLEVGIYLLETMVRLPVADEGGKAVGDRVLLGPIQVTP